MVTPPLVLASRSPRRQHFIGLLGVTAELRPADIDESQRPGESAHDLVRRLAVAKARAVHRPGEVVLGADTLVVDGEPSTTSRVLGQPRDRAHAREMLRSLSGRSHWVATGVATVGPEASQITAEVVTVRVSFAELSDDRIAWYLSTGEADDKAGAYGAQGAAGAFVEGIVGDHSAVVGLPMATTARLLGAAGVPVMGGT